MKSSKSCTLAALALAFGFLIALTGCHGRPDSADKGLTPVRLQLDWYPQPENGGFITGGAQTGRMTAARWQAGYEQLKALGILSGPLDPATAYSLKFVQ